MESWRGNTFKQVFPFSKKDKYIVTNPQYASGNGAGFQHLER